MSRLVLIVALCGGCLARNPQACDKDHPDCPDGETCNTDKFMCVRSSPGDGGEDMHVGDLGEADFAVGDAAVIPDGADLATECDGSMNCSDPSRPVCSSGFCRSCRAGDDSQCAEHNGVPYCEPDGGRCVECTPLVQASACPSPSPVCGAGSACRQCLRDSECTSGVCKSTGECATAGEIAYVDNFNIQCSARDLGAPRDGSRGNPFCEIKEGIASGRPFVRVTGHGTGAPYDAITVGDGQTVTVIGPEPTDPPAVIFALLSTATSVTVTAVSGNASLTLSRIQVGDPNGLLNKDAVGCSGTNATLVIKNSAIFKSALKGINAVNCHVALDSDRIAFNQGGGVLFSQATHYDVRNSLFYKNSGGPAVTLDTGGGATGVFQLNTLADNGVATYGGIDCGSMSPAIEASILWHNMTTETFGCRLIDCDVDGVDPMFLDATNNDYRIGNPALSDLVHGPVDGGSGSLSNHDFFGTFRPSGLGWDVGAHEKQ